jgi:hypothetical protein
MEREKLEREIYHLTQIIGADAFALVSKSTPVADRAGLRKQIDIRTTMWAGLLKQLSGDSSLPLHDCLSSCETDGRLSSLAGFDQALVE